MNNPLFPLQQFFMLPKQIINLHFHGRGMNQAHKTTPAQTLYEAALAGISIAGFMPNTDPSVTSELVKKRYLYDIDFANQIFGYGVRAYLWFGVTDNNLAEFEKALDDPRVIGLKIYPLAENGAPVTTGTCGVMKRETILAAMRMALAKNKAVAVHCDDPKIIAEDKGYSIRAEVEHVKMVVECMRQVPGVKVIICHVSCSASAEVILAAQAEGLLVAIELCPQYLWFDNQKTNWRQDLPDNFYLCLNRLRGPEEREYLISLLSRENKLIIISSDHAPHTRTEKLADPLRIPSGIPSIIETVPVILTLALQRHISEAQVARLISFNAAEFLGIQVERELVKTELVLKEDDFLYNRGVVENPWRGAKLYFPTIDEPPSPPEIMF
jgi:dihydroorotase